MIPHITPMLSVPGALIGAIGDSGSYRLAAESLLDQAWSLDAHLCPAFEAVPMPHAGAYYLNLNRLDGGKSRDLFLAIRRHKGEIDSHFPLLGHAACLTDYISHTTTNLRPLMDRERKLLAAVPNTCDALQYTGVAHESFEWSLAIHLGLFPFSIFGRNVFYDDLKVAATLGQFGLGTILYLELALRPELAHGNATPAEIVKDGVSRPAAQRPLEIRPDGSLVVKT
jgi:hypothetical protein